MSKTKVLNLYAGIGGNRKLWTDVDVTAVEWDEEKAEIYRDYFPDDKVVVADAHEYLTDSLFEQDWDYIWASPPCPTHSQMEQINHRNASLRYPDMKLYQELIILEKYAGQEGYDYTVENVISYYEPLYEPQTRARHYLWANFTIPKFDGEVLGISGNWKDENWASFNYDRHEEKTGFDLSEYDLPKHKKSKMLKNCVDPQLGKHVFESRTTQDTLPGVEL